MTTPDNDLPPCIGERMIDAAMNLFGRFYPPASQLIDAHSVTLAVTRYAREIGCNSSNGVAAANYGLRTGGDTIACIRHGKDRARNLLHRQNRTTPPEVA